jgi:hypothetical protein
VKEAIGEPFFLQNLIVPVALVDPPTLTATVTAMVLGTPFTAGPLVAPAANAIWADTGQLAAGNWDVLVWVTVDDMAATWRYQRRDPTNATTVWDQRFGIASPGTAIYDSAAGRIVGPYRITLLGNERIRVLGETAVAAGRTVLANIWANGPF